MHFGVKELKPVLKREIVSPCCDLFIEAHLAKYGILRLLEAMNLIPVVENPNPFDSEKQLRAHDAWWRQHSDEAAAYCSAIEARRQALLRVNEGLIRASELGRISHV